MNCLPQEWTMAMRAGLLLVINVDLKSFRVHVPHRHYHDRHPRQRDYLRGLCANNMSSARRHIQALSRTINLGVQKFQPITRLERGVTELLEPPDGMIVLKEGRGGKMKRRRWKIAPSLQE